MSIQKKEKETDYRNEIFIKFKNLLNNEDDSKKIEENIFNYTTNYIQKKNLDIKLFKKIYISKSRQIYHNLDENSYVKNIKLKKLLNKKIKLDKICDYSYEELNPTKWKKFSKDIDILNSEIFDNKKINTTDQFKCPKCKNNKCVYFQLQTRSADEGITSFITCISEGCGFNWKEN